MKRGGDTEDYQRAALVPSPRLSETRGPVPAGTGKAGPLSWHLRERALGDNAHRCAGKPLPTKRLGIYTAFS